MRRSYQQFSQLTLHSFLVVLAVVLLITFLIYVFVVEHKTNVEGNDLWQIAFRKVGLTKDQIADLTHDDEMWYYQGVSTCINYGDWDDTCPKHEGVCAGGDTYGNAMQQAAEIRLALQKGGVHPGCPLIYSGAD